MNEILALIKKHRLRRGWSEYALAEQSGIPQSTISSWYRKDVMPTISSLERTCEAFGMTLAQFFAEGEEAQLTEDQQILFSKWSTLTDRQKQILLELMDAI